MFLQVAHLHAWNSMHATEAVNGVPLPPHPPRLVDIAGIEKDARRVQRMCFPYTKGIAYFLLKELTPKPHVHSGPRQT